MEIYSQDVNVVKFKLPAGISGVSATASLNGGAEIALPVVSGTENAAVREFTLPYIQDEGTVRVFYRFTTNTFDGQKEVTVTDQYDVVTKILPDEEILNIHPNATPEEVEKIEKAVRHIINAHTGQVFGRFTGTYYVRGNDNPALLAPRRMISLAKVNGALAAGWFEIDSDGWTLRMHSVAGVPPVKADYYGFNELTGGVIFDPFYSLKLGMFLSTRTYELNGVWGWEEVPAQVAEAAKLLVNDYACADAAYRDRFLTSMTAADWRIQFNSGAFVNTGNVRADQLLADYVVSPDWVIV